MEKPCDVLAIGSLLWDIIGVADCDMPPGGDVPGRIRRRPGGVAMNIASALARQGLKVALLSVVGRDPEGDELIRAAEARGLVTDHVHRPDGLPSDRYMAIEAANGMIAAIADAHSLERAGARILDPLRNGSLAGPERPWRGMVALDGNLTAPLLAEIAGGALFDHADLRIAPASPGKAGRLAAFLGHRRATVYLNRVEANILTGRDSPDSLEAARALTGFGLGRVAVTDGPAPATVVFDGAFATAPPPAVSVRRLTGAGDSFMAAHMAAERRGQAGADALRAALAATARYISEEECDEPAA